MDAGLQPRPSTLCIAQDGILEHRHLPGGMHPFKLNKNQQQQSDLYKSNHLKRRHRQVSKAMAQ